MDRKRLSSLTISISMLFIIIVVGVLGYMIIEGYDPFDAFFMTMITVSTVGFGEVQPLSHLGELFTVFLIIFSFGAFAYAVTSITRFVVDGGFRYYFVNRRTHKKITRLYEHVILCGYGRNGSEAARVLHEKGEDFVIIDENSDLIEELRSKRFLYVEGDATDDEVLKRAGINRAKSLITTLPNDADNLSVVLSVRALNKTIQIISRASYEWSDVKLKKAGADNVIMPDMVGGRRMAKLVARPDIIAFLDYMMLKQKGEVQLMELSCRHFAPKYLEKTIGELKFKKISGVNIVGLKDHEGIYHFNPSSELMLSCDYKLFVMGTKEQYQKLKAAVFEKV